MLQQTFINYYSSEQGKVAYYGFLQTLMHDPAQEAFDLLKQCLLDVPLQPFDKWNVFWSVEFDTTSRRCIQHLSRVYALFIQAAMWNEQYALRLKTSDGYDLPQLTTTICSFIQNTTNYTGDDVIAWMGQLKLLAIPNQVWITAFVTYANFSSVRKGHLVFLYQELNLPRLRRVQFEAQPGVYAFLLKTYPEITSKA